MEQQVTGTHQSSANPWDSYASEMEAKMSKQMEVAVAEYSERAYEAGTSSQQTQEELHRQREMNAEVSKEYQWMRPSEYDDADARIGRVLSHAEFIKLLRKAGVKCYYVQHIHDDKAVLMIRKFPLVPPMIGCWAQVGYMPELSIMNFDDHGVPLAERRRGWRTCILQLILNGTITEEKANQVFGKPKITKQYNRYNSMLQAFRNAGSSLGE